MPIRNVKKPSSSSKPRCTARLEVVALAHAPFEEAAGGLGVVVGLEADAERLELAAHAGTDSTSEPLCTRQKSSPAVNGCACAGVTADSVAMRVCADEVRAA